MAGSRRGLAPEATLSDTPWSTEVAWRPEVTAARRARADADADSRDPKTLALFQRQARPSSARPAPPCWLPSPNDSARTGSRTASSPPERPRAKGLGWPDAYAYTKSLGERALLETRGEAAGDHRAAVDHRVGPG